MTFYVLQPQHWLCAYYALYFFPTSFNWLLLVRHEMNVMCHLLNSCYNRDSISVIDRGFRKMHKIIMLLKRYHHHTYTTFLSSLQKHLYHSSHT